MGDRGCRRGLHLPRERLLVCRAAAVEFGVEMEEYRGAVTVPPPRVFQRLFPERPRPEKCLEAYDLQRTRSGILTPPPPPSSGREHLFDPFQEQIRQKRL
jgi:hypothetical protein